jgi:hypothetical protein
VRARARGLTKRTVLHELYHHLVETKGLKMPLRTEKKEANNSAGSFVESFI